MINRIINAVNLHNGGGKTYLYLLHSFLDRDENFIILDNRFKGNYIHFKSAKVIFVKKSIFRNLQIFTIRSYFFLRYFYTYKKNNNFLDRFTEIYLNGLPPFIRFKNTDIYIFAHNRLIFENFIPPAFNFHFFKLKLNLLIQKILLNLFLRKSDFVIVQTNSMFKLVRKYLKNKIVLQESLWGDYSLEKFNFIKNNLNGLDMNLLDNIKNLSLNNILFFFPASFYQYKNHMKLLEAFNLLYKKSSISFKLLLTIDMNDLKNINNLKLNKPCFIFLGKLNYSNVINIYQYIDYLVFPSLKESYGLPLIEANINNIKIIASDLDYVYEVCRPYLTFDPFSVKDIFNKLKISLDN